MVSLTAQKLSKNTMGKTTNYLLVRLCLGLLLLTSLPSQASVQAEDYDAFWLWSGVRAQPILNNAQNLYLLNGQIAISYNGKAHFIDQGNGLIKHYHKQLWLVYRAHTLNWSDDIFTTLNKQLKQWQQANIKITGVQIDFDAPTHQLTHYLTFLIQLRKKLPSHYKISITGLMDWTNRTDITLLNQFAPTIDEIIIQTYQGRHTVPNYQQYLHNLNQLTIPFKIGLVQYGDWKGPPHLTTNPCFKGYVIFLQNPANK